MTVDDYIRLMGEHSRHRDHELVLACLEYFDICGTSELTLEQAAEFWEIAGRCGSGI